jgi:hypothetical protein
VWVIPILNQLSAALLSPWHVGNAFALSTCSQRCDGTHR